MKLFENMEEMGGTIHSAIKQMINELLHDDIDDDQLEDIINTLSLSDVLELDTAYTNGDAETVRVALPPVRKIAISTVSAAVRDSCVAKSAC